MPSRYDNDPLDDPYERYFRPGQTARSAPGEATARTAVVSQPEVSGSDFWSSDLGEDTPPPRSSRHTASSGGQRAARRAERHVGRRPRRSPSRMARRKQHFFMTTALMSVIVLLCSGGLWAFSDYAMSKIKRIDPFAGLQNRPQRSVAGAMNILIAGADRREGIPPAVLKRLNLGKDAGQRSDTMILAHISKYQDRVVLVSLPRDSLVTIPRHRSADGSWVPPQRAKLNASYAFGGPRLAVATVEKATGVRIDHYLEVNFLGFINVVNALDRVPVCTPVPIHDRRSGLHLSAGKHMLNGAQALAYVRTRYSLGDGSDLGRIDRQQEFLASMLQRATSTGTLLNPVKLSRFLDATLSSIRADEGLTADKMRALAMQLRDLSPNNISFITVPISNPAYTVPGVGMTVKWDEQQSGLLFQRIKNDEPIVGTTQQKKGALRPTIPPERIAVDVYNAAGIPGLGARTAGDLENVGFMVPAPARNWDGPMGAEQTVIEYGPSRSDSVRTVQAAIPGSVLRENPARGDDIAVIVGSGYSGTKEVQVVPAQRKLQPKTAAQNPCK